MIDLLRREFIYLWYYFELQLKQIFGYWALGIVIGSVISVFLKDRPEKVDGHYAFSRSETMR